MLPFIAYRLYIARRIRRARRTTENLKLCSDAIRVMDTKKMIEDAFRDFKLPSTKETS